MKIKNLSVNKSKFGENAYLGGRFVLNFSVHSALSALAVAYTVRHPNLWTIVLSPIAVTLLAFNCHRINFKLAKESRKKKLPIEKALIPQTKKKVQSK